MTTVSVLVPFRAEKENTIREENWAWLEKWWRASFPGVELVVGEDTGMPFSKSAAVNDAYRKSTGDILVVADADSFMPPPFIGKAIEYVEKRGCLAMPWSAAWRLTKEDSRTILESDPEHFKGVPAGCEQRCRDPRPGPETQGMLFVITREGFERVAGFDERFRGWGMEDVSFGLSTYTLVGRNKLMLGDAYALWHPRPRSKTGYRGRVWEGDDGHMNVKLGKRYRAAYGKPLEMAEICKEHPLKGSKTPVEPGPNAVWEVAHPLVTEFIGGGVLDGTRIAL